MGTSTDVTMLGTHFQLPDRNDFATFQEPSVLASQSGVNTTSAEATQMIYSQATDNNQVNSIEQLSRIEIPQQFLSPHAEHVTPSDTNSNTQLPTPISAQPCNHYGRFILVVELACGHTSYYDTSSGNMLYADLVPPATIVPRISAQIYSEFPSGFNSFHAGHYDSQMSTSSGPHPEATYGSSLGQG